MLSIRCVTKNDPLINLHDPIIGRKFEIDEFVVFCPVCLTPHLLESWQYNDHHCSIANCKGEGFPQINQTAYPAFSEAVLGDYETNLDNSSDTGENKNSCKSKAALIISSCTCLIILCCCLMVFLVWYINVMRS